MILHKTRMEPERNHRVRVATPKSAGEKRVQASRIGEQEKTFLKILYEDVKQLF